VSIVIVITSQEMTTLRFAAGAPRTASETVRADLYETVDCDQEQVVYTPQGSVERVGLVEIPDGDLDPGAEVRNPVRISGEDTYRLTLVEELLDQFRADVACRASDQGHGMSPYGMSPFCDLCRHAHLCLYRTGAWTVRFLAQLRTEGKVIVHGVVESLDDLGNGRALERDNIPDCRHMAMEDACLFVHDDLASIALIRHHDSTPASSSMRSLYT